MLNDSRSIETRHPASMEYDLCGNYGPRQWHGGLMLRVVTEQSSNTKTFASFVPFAVETLNLIVLQVELSLKFSNNDKPGTYLPTPEESVIQGETLPASCAWISMNSSTSCEYQYI